MKTNDRDQRPHCSCACSSLSLETHQLLGRSQSNCTWERNHQLVIKKSFTSLYLKNTGFVHEGEITSKTFYNLFTFGVFLNIVFFQPSYRKHLAEKCFNSRIAQGRRS